MVYVSADIYHRASEVIRDIESQIADIQMPEAIPSNLKGRTKKWWKPLKGLG